MLLKELTVTDFAAILGSAEPAPGGGSASAVAGTLGISLTKMVTELTMGKKKYAEHQELMEKIHEQANRLQESFLAAIDEDTEAFNQVSAVFAMPKDTVEEKAVRAAALQRALQGAAASPMKMMELAVASLNTRKEVVGKSNINAASDLGVAALNLKSALQGAWLNVLINLSGIKDPSFVAEYQEKGQKLVDQGIQLADAIYSEIEKLI